MRRVRLPEPRVRLEGRGATFRFYHADCREILPGLTERVHVVVTSPPYNLGVRYRTYADNLPRDRYLAWTGEWIAATARVLVPKGSLFLNVGTKPTDPWAAMDVAQAARRHLRLQNVIHWIKSIALDPETAGLDLAVGHYKPINSRRFLNDCHEFIFHFSPTGETPLDRLAIGVRYQDKSNISRWRGAAGGVRCRGNTWFIPYETIQSRERERPHPATFPSRLPEYCLRLHGLRRAPLVVDPFVGLGATAMACARLGLDFIGIDLDPAYLEEAVSRTARILRSEKETAGLW